MKLLVFYALLFCVFTPEEVKSESFVGSCHVRGSLMTCSDIKEQSRLAEVFLSLNRDHKIRSLTISGANNEVVSDFIESLDHYRLHELKEVSILESGLQQVPRQIIEVVHEPSQQLKVLNFSKNHISHVPSDILGSPNLVILDLSFNKIHRLEDYVATSMKLFLYENPDLSCGWLQTHFAQIASEGDFNSRLICGSSKGVFNQMTVSQVRSVMETQICEDCPCFASNQALTVNCSSKGLSNIPQSLPYETKVVILENNFIKELQFNETKNWNNVLYLILNNNTIDNLSGFLSDQGSEILRNLVLLNMESNHLKTINGSLLNPKIEKLYLKNNPWICDCQLVDFRSWLEKHVDRVNDIDQIRCSSNDDRNMDNGNSVIISLKPDQLCPELKEIVLQEDPVKNAVLDCLSVSLLLLTSFILAKVFYDSRWQKRTGKLPKFFRYNK